MKNHTHTPSDIARFILLCLYGEINPQEQQELEKWLNLSEKNRKFYKKIKSDSYWATHGKEYASYNATEDWKKVAKRLKSCIPFYRHWITYAAILVLALGIGILATFYEQQKDKQQNPMVTEMILPGFHQARLLLDNGQEIDLKANDSVQHQQIQRKDFTNDGKTLSYHKECKEQIEKWHTLRTPRGGEYKVVLSDGTQIWLNAETELTYPTHFIGKERKVLLKGEAYFEVAPDSLRPFYVETSEMAISVLGTSFDVTAYPESITRTTLVEGCVAVSSGEQYLKITPGQQAIKHQGNIKIKRVNPNAYIAWKDKRFVYEDRLLEEVLNDLERWYNIDIEVIDKEILHLHLTANLPKYENMDQVLEIIKYAICIHFEIVGRTVIIRKD